MKKFIKNNGIVSQLCLTAILLPMNVMANEGEAKTITIA